MASGEISNLPDEVINEILMFLPIREAVKTCVLSTSWRYKWTSLPNLVFDTCSIPSHIEGEQLKTSLFLRLWLLRLSRKMLSHLSLLFKMSTNNTYQIPSCLFSCQTLRNLELKDCKLILPSQYQGFSNLTNLKLLDVTLTNQTFESLLVKIPLLYRLSIINCKSLTNLIINAPNLVWVDICGHLIQSITFQNAQKAFWPKSESLDKEDSREVQLHKEDGIFHSLRIVNLKGFIGVKYDMGFTEFILLNAMVLKTFYIKWEEKAVRDKNMDAVENISQFQKASSNAKVIFINKV
ncbi:hypothetical protein AQUCO_01000383v1 [Aquilegia coerulea]|uniref:F-box domain-containing protein n=1 Tax=Aquilegia coerulea TaxID=218851 RepID=A0A2G5E9N9_AQUCA|nr:hypothetical protein AQUCO_01000383v1 [Aquilegia coerulea]